MDNRDYFQEAATVPSSEEIFNMDEYSDAVMITKPQITISPVDIYYLHKMLSVNVDQLVDEGDNQLPEILKDLGSLGDEVEELGEEDSQERATNKVPIWLLLNNKFEVPENDTSNIKALFIRTKRMVVDVIRFQPGKTLKAILETPADGDMEEQHLAFTKRRRAELEQLAKSDPELEDVISHQRSDVAYSMPLPYTMRLCYSMSLEETKEKILYSASVLEKEGLCSSEQGYQSLLNAVAQDIRNQRIYRNQRKQDLAKLKHTLEELEMKRMQQSEAMDYYDHYVKDCMKHMGKATTKKRFGFLHSRRKETASGQFMGSYTTNAYKLKERGVIVSVGGVSDFHCPWMFPVPIPQNDQLGYGGTSFQSSLSLGTWKFFSPIEYCHSISFLNRLRHLQIEVTSEQVGVFNISAKGVGVTMASEQLLFQELLQKQYENVDTMEIFDMCIVNVNLLIFLINKKFYHK
eukprot:gene8832-1192_t